jgi:polysaccharide biosynthesis protein VpsQ
MVSARIKIITLIYVFILAGIVVLADLRGTQYLLNFVGSLPHGDKIGHFCLMGIFSLLINLTLSAKTFRFWKLNYLLGSLIVLTIVTAEEFSQIFIRGRAFDLADLAFDYAGIFIFGEIARFICGKFIRN